MGYNMYIDIFVLKSKIFKVENGDKVFVKIEGWEVYFEFLVGSVIKVLGKFGDY